MSRTRERQNLTGLRVLVSCAAAAVGFVLGFRLDIAWPAFALQLLLVIAFMPLGVVLHEAGHLLLARISGIEISRIQIGRGPKLASFAAAGSA